MLLAAEMRRFRLRRLIWLLMVAGILASLLVLLLTWQTAQPVTDQMREQAEISYQEALHDWDENGDEQVQECLDAQADAVEAGEADADADYGCDDLKPQRQWFLPYEATLAEYSQGTLLPFLLMILGAIGLAIGTTFVAAEYSSGSISTLLTFNPRRMRVYAAKILAVLVATIPISLILVAIIMVGTWQIFSIRGLDANLSHDYVMIAVRALAVLPAAAVAGAVLGFLVRSTAIAVAVVGAVAIVWEGILTQVMPAFTPYSFHGNLFGWLSDGFTYYEDQCSSQPDGSIVCNSVEHYLSFGWSAGALAIVGVVLVAAGAVVFKRRDIA